MNEPTSGDELTSSNASLASLSGFLNSFISSKFRSRKTERLPLANSLLALLLSFSPSTKIAPRIELLQLPGMWGARAEEKPAVVFDCICLTSAIQSVGTACGQQARSLDHYSVMSRPMSSSMRL